MELTQPSIPYSSVAVLRAMPVGSSMVLLEPVSRRKAPGSYSYTFATRLGIKISTQKCLIVLPKSDELIPAVIVTSLT